ncbi:MAG: hypothetical protein K2M44_03570 [Clostridia bacterium]|nr:hypothetical protein [Clostridia bacterium]
MAKLTQLLAPHITLQEDLAPKSETAHGGRLRRMNSVIKENTGRVFSLNILTILFLMPLIAILIIWLPLAEDKLVADMNFSAGLGIGYGAVDQTLEGIEAIYNLRQLYILCSLAPGLAIFGVGVAGAMQVIRNLMWGVEIKSFKDMLKHFGRGIARHWYKSVPLFLIGGLIGTSGAYALIEVLKRIALFGSAGAGYWVWMILSFVVLFLFVTFLIYCLPMSVCYRFKAKDLIKNSLILDIILILPGVVVSAFLCGIPLIMLAGNIVRYIVYGFYLLFGTSLWLLIITAYGQYACEGFINRLHEFNTEQENKKAEQERKTQQKQPSGGKQKGNSQVSNYKKKNKSKKGGGIYNPLHGEDKDAPFVSVDKYGNKDGNKR